MTTPNPDSADGLFQRADQRRRRAAKYGVAVALGAWVATFGVYAVLKSVQPATTLINIVLLVWNAVMVGAPFLGFVVYRRMR